MKKLLLLLFLVIGLSFVVQAIPAPDRDVGTNVEYVMPSVQINQVFLVNAVQVPHVLYLDIGQPLFQPMQPTIKKQNQCLLPVIPPYKGPMSVVRVNDNQYKTGANFT